MRRVYIVILFLTLIAVTGCFKKNIKRDMKERAFTWENPVDIEMLGSEKEGNFCIIYAGYNTPDIVPGRYFISKAAYAKRAYDIKKSHYTIRELDRYEINIYDLKTFKLIKTLDIKQIISPYLEDWQIYSMYNMHGNLGEYKGKYYVICTMEKRKTNEEISRGQKEEIRDIWIDIEEETASWIDKEVNPVDKGDGDYENIGILAETSILAANGLKNIVVGNSNTFEDTSYILIPTNELPKNNKKLYNMFPELKKVIRARNVYAKIFLHPKTDNMEVLSLILSEGEHINFDAIDPDSNGTYGYYEKNGEKHYITKGEYEQFKREYEEYFGRQE